MTTNLTLEELQHPEDTAHARINDRLLEMCSPLCFTGENLRKADAQRKMERLKRDVYKRQLQTLVIALGAGLGIWGVINLLEVYGNDNPGANAHVR